jgi:hypothetical protein
MYARSIERSLSCCCLALCHAHCPWYWACSKHIAVCAPADPLLADRRLPAAAAIRCSVVFPPPRLAQRVCKSPCFARRRPHHCTALSDSPPVPSPAAVSSPRPPHRSPPICNPLVRRHPVASHGPARLFHYHATPIISFALSCLSPTCTPRRRLFLLLAAALRLIRRETFGSPRATV